MAASMFASAAAGAGLELLFSTLLGAILQVKKDCSSFRSILGNLEETLKSLGPTVKKIDTLNLDFDRPHEIDRLKEILQKGDELVRKCYKVRKYDFLKKHTFTKKLVKWESSLKRLINIDIQVHQYGDQKEVLFGVRQLSCQLNQMSMSLSKSLAGSVSSGRTGFGGFRGLCSPPECKVRPVGLEVPLGDLKKKLLEDAEQLVVVSAPGGCGKTTLAITLCNDDGVKGRFDNIFFVTVTQKPNLINIVQRLFQHMGCEVQEHYFQSQGDALTLLENFLKKQRQDIGPILLVLDDVWSGSEAEQLLNELMFHIKDYKIFVTSRYEFPTFGSTYKLKTLNDEDAMTLFRQSAFPPNGNSYVPDQDDLTKLVKSLKGFPLLISVVGKSLRMKPVAVWNKRIDECSKAAAATALSNHSDLLNCLQSSVDAMNEDPVVKECYMDLGSFPEDHRIPATALIDIWVELHKLDENDAIVNLHDLSNRSLAELTATRKFAGEHDGIYDEHFVTQHDLLRELAIKQSDSESVESRKRLFIDKNKISEWQKEQRQLSIHASLLSIYTDETFPSTWYEMEAPEVEVLVLNLQTKNYTLPEFIQRMAKLTVLIVTNNSFFPTELRNFLLLCSLCNLKRIRLEKILIPADLFESVQLKNLEKISLVMCNISQVFNQMFDISKALPKLVEINLDYCEDLEELHTGFCDLVRLNKLSITNCHRLVALPDKIGELENLEILRLNSCICLEELPSTIGNLGKLRILDISDCFSIKQLPDEIGDLKKLRKLYMMDCSSCELPASVMDLSQLKEVIGDEETANSWKFFESNLPDLTIKVHKDVNLHWLR